MIFPQKKVKQLDLDGVYSRAQSGKCQAVGPTESQGFTRGDFVFDHLSSHIHRGKCQEGAMGSPYVDELHRQALLDHVRFNA